jgi:hypothetical protein
MGLPWSNRADMGEYGQAKRRPYLAGYSVEIGLSSLYRWIRASGSRFGWMCVFFYCRPGVIVYELARGPNPIIGGGGIMPFRYYLPGALKRFAQFKAILAFILDQALVCV